MQATILIVDDERHTREGLRQALEDDFDVYVAAGREEALEVLKHDQVDVVVTDLRLGGDDGMKVLEDAQAVTPAPVCIMMTAYGSVDTAVEAMKRGAFHFVTKPLNLDELEILIKRALQSRRVEQENRQLRQQIEQRAAVGQLLGKSSVMQPVFETIEQVAPTSATVLIQGESGTGKELVAKALHQLSGRPKAKLVTVHCAALSPELLESELFGHERGAFTGATQRRIGRFEMADGGTLFLDELGEISPSTQVKLLRALGEQTIERVGSSTPIKVNVRVIAATNRDLAGMVEDGGFREDLYFRLNVVHILMPPLRTRKEDIPLMVQSFLKDLAEQNGKPFKELSPEAMQCLLDYDWPGNVRELRTAVEHGVVMSNADKITPRHLPESLRGGRSLRGSRQVAAAGDEAVVPAVVRADDLAARLPLQDLNVEAMERRLIARALDLCDGHRSEAAKVLGLSRRTLQRKLKEMGGARN